MGRKPAYPGDWIALALIVGFALLTILRLHAPHYGPSDGYSAQELQPGR